MRAYQTDPTGQPKVRCASCGSPNTPGARFCKRCGVALPRQSEPTLAGMGDDDALSVPEIPDIPEPAEPAEAPPLADPSDESARSYLSAYASKDEAAEDLVAAGERTRALAELAKAAERRLQEAKIRHQAPVEVAVSAPEGSSERQSEREARQRAAEAVAEYFAQTRGPYEQRIEQDRWIDDYSGGIVIEDNPPQVQQEMAQDSVRLGRTCGCGCAIMGLLILAVAIALAIIGSMK